MHYLHRSSVFINNPAANAVCHLSSAREESENERGTRTYAEKLIESFIGGRKVTRFRPQVSMNSHLLCVAQVPNVIPVAVDLADWNATKRALADVGDVDLLVNNAGITELDLFGDIAPETIDKQVQPRDPALNS
ncbi:hypothetical protein HPB48_005233 [Haemaphysalis longicornis]|uniref:Uncharacterized protein n=1 Tax=Haemaphysalis longicornis TaxID=44386 RepID=A0A9J6FGA8_HAELO|nr:hypothetical protein HPB48_005233 [Haemaphysalis longicornis]